MRGVALYLAPEVAVVVRAAVSFRGNGLKVCRVNAKRVPARVVYVESSEVVIIDTSHQGNRHSMGEELPCTSIDAPSDNPIGFAVLAAGRTSVPNVTPREVILGCLAPERGRRNSHLRFETHPGHRPSLGDAGR